ncbi:hypothetical protein [uncultured Alistipes sp.]|uniref:hypothetical protein n=1 Tax=uncultured Alistipes sp. TaxID=538949 RepID=UPI00272C7A25|nr:hypothetical protein [uncultured Alistipes sp.]
MKIIMLHGKGNCGKTSTLNIVLNLLLQNGATAINSGITYYPNRKGIPGDSFDFKAFLKYKNKTVAIYSEGDRSRAIINHINQSASYDVLVCAANSSFSKPLSQLKPSDVLYPKTVATLKGEIWKYNFDDADKILQQI